MPVNPLNPVFLVHRLLLVQRGHRFDQSRRVDRLGQVELEPGDARFLCVLPARVRGQGNRRRRHSERAQRLNQRTSCVATSDFFNKIDPKRTFG